jgi:hypothetical protein
LVHKLRELNKKVIGFGVRASTSALLPPACDEFLFYENLEGVEVRAPAQPKAKTKAREPEVAPEPELGPEDLQSLITRTLGGLQRSSGDIVLASSLKRALLRKDSTFSEADYGFRAFAELLAHLKEKGVIELTDGPAKGDPVVQFAAEGSEEHDAFEVLAAVVKELQKRNGHPALSGLKNQVRKRRPDFSEKKFGYGGFLQFCKAAQTKGFIELAWDEAIGDYQVRVP